MLNKYSSILKTILTLVCLLGHVSYMLGQVSTYQIDTVRSSISFTVKHMGFLTVEGAFTSFSGTVVRTADKKLKSIESQIITKSMTTNNIQRDEIVLSDTYLNAVDYPHITFRSLRINDNQITGLLQIRGIEREVTLDMAYKMETNTDDSYIRCKTILKRSDFDIVFGAMESLVSNEIHIELEIFKK